MQKQVTQNSHTATTQYMGGYQYSNTRLQFFPTAEGYVKNTIIQGQNSYDYIYNLTDHLGNIRMSFGLDPKTQQLVKFEENNYYPFGLKHSRYNDQLREITEKQSYNIQLEDIITEKRSAQKTLAIPSNPDAEDIVLENSGYQYKYNGKEFQDELGLNMTAMDWRQYDPAIGKWVVQDPITHFDVSPYNAFNNNPVLFADPSGLEGMLSQLTHQSTDLLNKWGYGFEQSANNSSPFQGHLMTHRNPESKEQKGNNKYVFPEGDLRWNDWNSSSEVFRIVSNNTAHVYYASWFISKTGAAQGGGGCPNCLNPSTVGQQFGGIGGLTYPGGNNPKSYNGQYNYSYVPTILSEYPAIGHDRRYDNLKITGASGLFTDTRAIGADWRFVGEELSIAGNPFLNPIDRMSAGLLGVGLGFSALPKTLFQLSTPFGYMQTMMWYNISNQGVNNAPTIHKH